MGGTQKFSCMIAWFSAGSMEERSVSCTAPPAALPPAAPVVAAATEPEASAPGSSVVDNGADNGADDGDEPEVVRPASLHVRLNGTLLCSVVGCCRPSLMAAEFADGTMAMVCCELCVAGDGHTVECDASSAL